MVMKMDASMVETPQDWFAREHTHLGAKSKTDPALPGRNPAAYDAPNCRQF